MRRIFSIGALIALLTFAPASYAAETSTDAGASYMSKYVWRGLTLSDSYVLQPTAGFTYDAFTANFWSNYDGDTGETNETDITLSYSTEMGGLGLGLGYIFYALDGLSDTQEFYVSLGYEAVVSPTLTYYLDTEQGTGGFAVLALDYGIEAGQSADISLAASASYIMENRVVGVDATGGEYSGLHNGEIKASLSYALDETFSITPSIAYSFPLSDDAKDSIKAYSIGGKDSVFYGGLTASMSF